jgi:hypothetical protein
MQGINHQVDKQDLFRLIRFFYNLRHNDTIIKTASFQTISALKIVGRFKASDEIAGLIDLRGVSSSILNSEERLKFSLIKESAERNRVEDLFWMAEDMEYNKGEVGFLINWSKANTADIFQLNIFRKMLNAYIELIQAENEIKCDLLILNSYEATGNRVYWNSGWFKEQTFLAFALDWYKSKNMPLTDFLTAKRKLFIRSYTNVEQVQEESNFKRQLYVYYVLSQNILKKNDNWRWSEGNNFGVYGDFRTARSIFNQKYIFQQYKQQWHENWNRVVWIQRELKLGPVKIQALLDWSLTF